MKTGWEYPRYDLTWIGSDSAGKVAAFITGGEGPIPNGIFLSVADAALEGVLLELLPVVGSADLSYEGNFDTLVELCERGIFVYDWSDVHRVEGLKRAYERYGSPTNPIHTSELPTYLKDLSIVVKFKELRFDEAPLVRPDVFYECRYPEWT